MPREIDSAQSATQIEPTGTVFVELTLTGQWAISYLTEGWKPEERASLVAGDREAWDALRAAAEQQTLTSPDDVDSESIRIHATWKAETHG